MKVWQAYSEQARGIWRPRYVLEMRAELDEQEQEISMRHWLWDDELWIGPAAAQRDAEALSALDLARYETEWDAIHTRKAAGLKVKGIWTALVTAQGEARVTLGQLIGGRTFVAHDVVELWATENGIKAGVHACEAKLRRLQQFSDRHEDVSAPPQRDDGIAPSDWGRARRG